jgi:ABC-type multidrug transport system fused ATPase/permease subunit
MKILDKWRNGTFARSARILSRSDRRKMFLVAVIQVGLSLLDLLGVMLIGVLGALMVTGVQSREPGNRVNSILQIMHISGISFQAQAAILGISSVILLVGRTVISIFFTRRILFFLSRRGALISARLISRLLSQPMLTVQARTTQETLYSVTAGVEVIVLSVLATAISLLSDCSVLVVMTIGLFVVDPIIAIGTFAVFAGVGVSLYRLMHVRARQLGRLNSKLHIKSNEKIVEVFSSYRESVVRNRRDYYAREIGKMRLDLADAMAEVTFMPYISKYVIEVIVLLGAVVIGAVQFILQDATHAVATISVFIAAGTRIAPAVLRVQQSSVSIRMNLGVATPTLDLIEELGSAEEVENTNDEVDTVHEGFTAVIEVKDVTMFYPNADRPAVVNVSLKIPVGSSVAIVGPSGAGKTTIVDVLLGVLNPDSGSVEISGLPPLKAVAKWPGAVAYVPQDVVISNGTVRENIALGYPIEVATDELITSALKVASLDRYVASLPLSIDTPVGERGTKISGGQRQRLGIARAMFTKPHLLVLDEATSSLDGETEASISSAIHSLRGSITVVMIAHRLSTVRNADIVVYMSEGRIVATGSFDEVRKVVPDFDRQAKLMGL